MYRHVHDPLRHSRHTREVFACCRESCYRGAADNVPLTMYLLGMPKLLQVIMRLALCRARLRANYCMVLPSVVWTLVLYVCRVIREGGIACLIGPVHPTFWLSRWFADAWMLFPTEAEYTEASAMPAESKHPLLLAIMVDMLLPRQWRTLLRRASCCSAGRLPSQWRWSGDGNVTVTLQFTRSCTGSLDTGG